MVMQEAGVPETALAGAGGGKERDAGDEILTGEDFLPVPLSKRGREGGRGGRGGRRGQGRGKRTYEDAARGEGGEGIGQTLVHTAGEREVRGSVGQPAVTRLALWRTRFLGALVSMPAFSMASH